jgi:hypothetical protein
MRGGKNQEVIREAHVTLKDPKCAADAAEDKARKFWGNVWNNR